MDYPENTASTERYVFSKKFAEIKKFVRQGTHKDPLTTGKGKLSKITFDKLFGMADSKLTKIGSKTPEEKHLLLLLFVAILFSAICHVVQIIFFLLIRNPTLALINFFSICTYVVCTVMLIKKRAVAAGIIFSSEITIVAVAIAYLIGTDTFLFSYFFVVLLIQMIIPYASWKIRIPIIVSIMVSLFISFIIGNTFSPLVDITPIKTVYSVFNIFIGAGSIIAIIAVSNFVHKMIWQINKINLDKYMDEAHLDALTGLYNRRYASIVFEEIRNNIEQCNACCIAMLDIDDFKQINDRFGHDFGDVSLHKLAEIIKASLRKTDYVFRWGGEEFIILLRNFDINESYRVLDKMRIKIQESEICFKEHTAHLTVTIGLSKCSGGNIEQSVKASDQNLYKGKCSGKNVVVI